MASSLPRRSALRLDLRLDLRLALRLALRSTLRPATKALRWGERGGCEKSYSSTIN